MMLQVYFDFKKLGNVDWGARSRTSRGAVAVPSSDTDAPPTRVSKRARQGSAQEEAPFRQCRAAPRTHPDSQGPSTISPPSAITLKESSTLSAGVTVHSATGYTVAGTFLSAFSVVSSQGSTAAAAKHDETSVKLPAPHTPNLS
jgi:hypothetical protein